jgi:hypothetical protein
MANFGEREEKRRMEGGEGREEVRRRVKTATLSRR